MPGETPGPDQIIASNTLGLHALMRDLGAEPRLLPIARDNEASLKTAFELARDADLIVTIGGASVGDHDVVANLAPQLGFEQSFYKVAMRPGKPLMAGRFGEAMMIGLPGNPVSAMVCGHVFIAPVISRDAGTARRARSASDGCSGRGPARQWPPRTLHAGTHDRGRACSLWCAGQLASEHSRTGRRPDHPAPKGRAPRCR